MSKFTGEYPPEWTKDYREKIRAEADNRCERCQHEHEPKAGYALTVHHLDNDKSNLARWNLAALCQRCHLHIQGKVFLPQFYMFELRPWIVPHVMGYYHSVGINFRVAVADAGNPFVALYVEGGGDICTT